MVFIRLWKTKSPVFHAAARTPTGRPAMRRRMDLLCSRAIHPRDHGSAEPSHSDRTGLLDPHVLIHSGGRLR